MEEEVATALELMSEAVKGDMADWECALAQAVPVSAARCTRRTRNDRSAAGAARDELRAM